MNLIDLLSKNIFTKELHLCVGLDSDFEKIPKKFQKKGIRKGIFEFNKWIIEQTYSNAAAFKPNVVFYAGYGIEGLKGLHDTNKYLKKNHPNIPIIADCKRSEMKRSGELAAREIFEEFLFDALIVTPWFGFDTIEPYIKYKDKGVFVLCKDSNPSAGDIQDLPTVYKGKKMKVYEVVAHLVKEKWSKLGNVFCEAPLTYPKDFARVRQIVGDNMLMLVAGLGAQGGEAKDLRMGAGKKKNFIVNASRLIIFSKNPAKEAETINKSINYSLI